MSLDSLNLQRFILHHVRFICNLYVNILHTVRNQLILIYFSTFSLQISHNSKFEIVIFRLIDLVIFVWLINLVIFKFSVKLSKLT